MNKRKLILYISMSLDGYIATKEDDLTWLSSVEKEGEDYGYSKFIKNVDTYIVGRRTYKVVKKLTGGDFPQSTMFNKCYVVTRETKESKDGVVFYNGDLKELIKELKSKEGKNIYCDGGAEIVKLLMEKDLIDEYIISVIPVVLGDGIRLFKGGIDTIKLKAQSSKMYDTGLVQLHYVRQD